MEDRKWHSVEVGFEHEGVRFSDILARNSGYKSLFRALIGICSERETQVKRGGGVVGARGLVAGFEKRIRSRIRIVDCNFCWIRIPILIGDPSADEQMKRT